MSPSAIPDDNLQYELYRLDIPEIEANRAAIQLLLIHHDDGVRFDSVQALAKLGESSIELFRERLTLENDDLVLSEVITQLRDLDDEESIEEITNIYHRHPSHMVRFSAINALAKLIGVGAEEFFLSCLQTDRNRRVRVSIACALAWFGSTVGVEAIRDNLKSSEFYVRSSTANLLDYYLPTENRKALIEILTEARNRETYEVIRDELQSALDGLTENFSDKASG